jgi:hypothetical protein
MFVVYIDISHLLHLVKYKALRVLASRTRAKEYTLSTSKYRPKDEQDMIRD